MVSRAIYPNENMPPTTYYFSIGSTSIRTNRDLGSSQGISLFFFFFNSAHKQAEWVWCLTQFSSFLSQRLCRQYNYSTSVVHSCSEQISLFCLKNKHRQLSDLVPSVSATLLEGSCLPSSVLLHASFEETQLSLFLEKAPPRCSYRLLIQSVSTVVF